MEYPQFLILLIGKYIFKWWISHCYVILPECDG